MPHVDETKSADPSSPSPPPPQPFPPGILPKNEIEALSFLSSHPTYDGRNVTVMIFDTGCDVGAEGLRTTTEGKAKFIDSIDCTGSGDVDCSAVVVGECPPSSSSFTLVGVRGRPLTIPSTFKSPTHKYHLGVKRAFDLFPTQVTARLKKERKVRFDKSQREVESSLSHYISSKGDEGGGADENDFEVQMKEIRSLAKSFDDSGPLFDVVSFHDGDGWRVAVDTTESGDFTKATLMGEFRLTQQVGTFTCYDKVNYTVNVYEDGNVVSLVVAAGSHGTHVAGIVGAHYPEEPSLNGVAPGCQMISVKIGDTRIGSMETGQGLTRALMAAANNKVDLINMSYGEGTSKPSFGRFSEMLAEVVGNRGIIFVSSAGNNGPALTTVGAPGGTDENSIGVGAYVSPQMMEDAYSQRRANPETQFTWSSRGPTADGSRGVCVSSCGGAITAVPNCDLQRQSLMNGTSMSSPSCCGGIALLLSGMKQLSIPHTPRRIRQSIEETARPISSIEPLALGAGLLQVGKAFDHLVKHRNRWDLDITFKLSVADGQRGIYLRNSADFNVPYETTLTIQPVFPFAEGDESVDQVNRRKIEFHLQINLQVDVPWIDCPSHVFIVSGGRNFVIAIHGESLPPGVHFTEIKGFDASDPSCGALFRLPVTLTVPERVQNRAEPHKFLFTPLNYHPGEVSVHRKFLTVPLGTSHAIVKVKLNESPSSKSFMLHTVYLLPDLAFREREADGFFSLSRYEEKSYYVDLRDGGGLILEVCLAQYWSSVGGVDNVELHVEFFSLLVNSPKCIVMDGHTPILRVDCRNELRAIDHIAPQFTLNKLMQFRKPDSSNVEVLRLPRDGFVHSSKQISQLILEYSHDVVEDGTVVVRAPLLQGRLYESTLDSQLIMVFDQHMKHLGTMDAWPSGVSVKKGLIYIRLHIRHDDPAVLDKLKDMNITIECALPKPIELNVYGSFSNALSGTTKLNVSPNNNVTATAATSSRLAIKKGQVKSMFVVYPDVKSIPSHCRPGDILYGTFQIHRTPLNVIIPSPADHLAVENAMGVFKLIIPDFRSGAAGKKDKEKEKEKEKKNGNNGKEEERVEVESKEEDNKSAEMKTETEPPTDGEAQSGEPNPKDESSPPPASAAEPPPSAASSPSPALREAQISYIGSLSGDSRKSAWEALSPQLLKDYSDCAPIRMLQIDITDESTTGPSRDIPFLQRLIQLIDSYLSTPSFISEDSVLRTLGTLPLPSQVDSTKSSSVEKKAAEKGKETLIKLYAIKAKGWMEIIKIMREEVKTAEGKGPSTDVTLSSSLQSFDSTLRSLCRFIDIFSLTSKSSSPSPSISISLLQDLSFHSHVFHNRLGAALSIVNAEVQSAGKDLKTKLEKRISLWGKLEQQREDMKGRFDHWRKVDENAIKHSFPKDFDLF